MKVAVLGCGPAGLMAAHAANQQGHHTTIFSHKVLSPMAGAQYLHESIPGVTPKEAPLEITYAKQGSAEGYATKVYGSPSAPTSWQHFPEGEHPAWDLHSAYRRLVRMYWADVNQLLVVPQQQDIARLCASNDVVLCTLPAKNMCISRKHEFPGAFVTIERWEPDGEYTRSRNVITYSGDPVDSWYRRSWIQGTGWQETPGVVGEVGPDRLHGVKPLDTDCDCHERDNFFRLGRFGQWKKGVLTSDAYRQALEIVSEGC